MFNFSIFTKFNQSISALSSTYSKKFRYVLCAILKFPLLLSLLLLPLSGCVAVNEGVVYPDKISFLSTPATDDATDNKLSSEINASLDDTWKALVSILHQHAFIVHVDRLKQDFRTLGYIDRTTLSLDSKHAVIEMPFQIALKEITDNTTSMTVVCRWDLITTDEYREEKGKRFEDLKNGMLTEAYLLINQVNLQLATIDRWQWINKESL